MESLADHTEDVVQTAPCELEYDGLDWDDIFKGILNDAYDRPDLTL